MASAWIQNLVDLQQQLELPELQDAEILRIFDALNTSNIDKACLVKTKVGNSVSKYKKHPNKEVVRQCKLLLCKWRAMVTQSVRDERDTAAREKTQLSPPSPQLQQQDTVSPKPNVSVSDDDQEKQTGSADASEAFFTSTTAQGDAKQYMGPYSNDYKRDRGREILFNAFLDGIPADQAQRFEPREVSQILASVEEALWEHHVVKRNHMKDYLGQLRAIKCNLADKKNPEFNVRVYFGAITPHQLTTLQSTEMASDAKKQERSKTKRDALEACQSDWDLRNIKRAEGQFPCGKCKSRNTMYFQLQTRSSDEPMTTFVNCLNCGNRWKF